MVRDIRLAEDLAQNALVIALERWPVTSIPDNPGAWLMTTAKRRVIDLKRRSIICRPVDYVVSRSLFNQMRNCGGDCAESSVKLMREGNAMRYLFKATRHSEAGIKPKQKYSKAMASYNMEMARAGVLIAADKLQPSTSGVPIAYPVPGAASELTAGPFLQGRTSSLQGLR